MGIQSSIERLSRLHLKLNDLLCYRFVPANEIKSGEVRNSSKLCHGSNADVSEMAGNTPVIEDVIPSTTASVPFAGGRGKIGGAGKHLQDTSCCCFSTHLSNALHLKVSIPQLTVAERLEIEPEIV